MGKPYEKKVMEFCCIVCNSDKSLTETVEEGFKVDDRYVLVGGVPSTVGQKCGERSFSRQTVEKVRLMVHKPREAIKSVPMQVYKFA